jgi:hypothetical protein
LLELALKCWRLHVETVTKGALRVLNPAVMVLLVANTQRGLVRLRIARRRELQRDDVADRIDEALDLPVRAPIDADLAVEDERWMLLACRYRHVLSGVVDWTFPEVCHRGGGTDSTVAERTSPTPMPHSCG